MSFDMLPTETQRFYVEFELRAEEDRAQTIEQGSPAFHDVEFAVITMPGGGLVVDKKITPELLEIWKRGDGQRKKANPFALESYNAWKEDREAPVDGIDLKNWPGVTPAQLKTCQMASIRTVEDLASANADTIRKLGMGAVALKDKAASYLESAQGNKSSEEISAMKVQIEALMEQMDKKDEQIASLMDQKPRRGRPPKQVEE